MSIISEDVLPAFRPDVQFQLAWLEMRMALTRGQQDAFVHAIGQAGYEKPSQFWEAAMAEPMEASKFIDFISGFHLNPSMRGVDFARSALNSLIKRACDVALPFILKDKYIERNGKPAREVIIDPSGATRWILSLPRRCELIPADLTQYLREIPSQEIRSQETPSQKARIASQAEVEPRRRGGRPPAADWSELEVALNREIDHVGLPSRDGAPEWRTQADVIRWLEPKLGKDEPGKTALKENVRLMRYPRNKQA